jgi:hypothetical protein
MPSYGPAGIRICLGTTALAPTITPQLKARKNEAAKMSERAEDAVRQSANRYLKETVVGDDDGMGRMKVNFLGNAPFLMCTAEETWDEDKNREECDVKDNGCSDNTGMGKDGKGVANVPYARNLNSSTPNRSHRPSRELRSSGRASNRTTIAPVPGKAIKESAEDPSPPLLSPSLLPRSSPGFGLPTIASDKLTPKALVLHVLLTHQTFLESFEDAKPSNLMIDVFFNGMLASSVLMLLKDLRSDRPVKSPHQVFAGTRVDHLVERPWVILPPDLNADGGCQNNKPADGAQDRWLEISAALYGHTDERGFNEWGERSPSGAFLESLARMDMPEQVGNIQKPGGRSFGVVDVIVTAGRGRKTAEGYLSRPKRMPDSRYKARFRNEELEDDDEDEELADAQPTNGKMRDSDQDAEAETDSEFEQAVRTASCSWPMPPPTTPLAPPSARALMPPPSSTEQPVNFVSSRDVCLSSSPGKMDWQSSPMSFVTGNTVPSSSVAKGPTPKTSFPGSSSLSSSQSRRVSIGDVNIASFNPTAPPNETPSFRMQELPQTTQSRSDGRKYVNLEDSSQPPLLPRFPLIGPVQLNGPLPPMGWFSAPRISQSRFSAPCTPQSRTSTNLGAIDPDQPRSSILIHRLFISGNNGLPIVDHTWSVSQRIASPQIKPHWDPRPNKRCLESLDLAERDMPLTRRRRSSARLSTPPPTSPGNLGPRGQAQDVLGSSIAALCPGVLESTELQEGEPGQYTSDGLGEGLGLRTHNGSAQSMPTLSTPAVPPTIASPNALPAPSLFAGPTSTPLGMYATPNFHHNSLRFSSSPLSSAPSSPALAPQEQALSREPVSADQLVLTPQPVLTSQPISTSQPVDITPSLLQPSQPTPSLPSHTPVRPIAPVRPRLSRSDCMKQQKKDKTKRYDVKSALNKINTESNPRLNRGSVIRFAESAKEEEGEGMQKPLRQIKCERMGEFTEEMVVVGVRFFVPG